jgi:hypothetical protein
MELGAGSELAAKRNKAVGWLVGWLVGRWAFNREDNNNNRAERDFGGQDEEWMLRVS